MKSIEIVGYVAATLGIISFSMKDIMKVRVFNLFCSICWMIYAVVNHNNAAEFSNTSLIILQLFMIYKLLKTKEVK